MAWWPLIPLTLMRLAGGIVTIFQDRDQHNAGLVIAAVILLNVGAIPLIVATLGQMRIVLADNYSQHPQSHKIVKLLRLSFGLAVGCLAAGGGVLSVSIDLARILSLVGYIIFAVVLAVLIAMEMYFFTRRHDLIESSRKVSGSRLICSGLQN